MKRLFIQKYSLIAADIFAALISYLFATKICNILRGDEYHQINLSHMLFIKIVDLLLMIILMWQKQLYYERRPNWEDLRLTYRALFTLLLINIPILFISREQYGLTRLFIVFWLSLFLFIPFLRIVVKLFLNNLGLWQRPLYIVGLNNCAIEAYQLLSSSNLMGYQVEGFVDLTRKHSEVRVKSQVLPVYDIKQLFTRPSHAEILICLDDKYLANHVKLINQLQKHFLSVMLMPELSGLPLYGIEVNHFFGNEQLLLRLENNLASRFNRVIKYSFDLVVALLLIPLVLLILALISLLIYCEDGGCPFFSQERIGKDGKLFKCLKFRTMHKCAEQTLNNWKNSNDPLYLEYVANNYKLPNDPRITKVGRFLRRTSLDELPQIFNILHGSMSLVGPRPLLPGEVNSYQDGLFYYQQVRPGITGLWQISGRSKTSFAERARLDTWYVKNWTLWYDVVILIKTMQVVIKREGAY